MSGSVCGGSKAVWGGRKLLDRCHSDRLEVCQNVPEPLNGFIALKHSGIQSLSGKFLFPWRRVSPPFEPLPVRICAQNVSTGQNAVVVEGSGSDSGPVSCPGAGFPSSRLILEALLPFFSRVLLMFVACCSLGSCLFEWNRLVCCLIHLLVFGSFMNRKLKTRRGSCFSVRFLLEQLNFLT